MKNCLFGADEFDLLKSFRANEDLTELIRFGILKKHKEKGGQFSEMENVENQNIINRSMIKIGG
jgi:cyclic pyranopterin phosphate synthase